MREERQVLPQTGARNRRRNAAATADDVAKFLEKWSANGKRISTQVDPHAQFQITFAQIFRAITGRRSLAARIFREEFNAAVGTRSSRLLSTALLSSFASETGPIEMSPRVLPTSTTILA
ncbi:MAG: hypothetical protein R3D82_14815 [Xanthobacteraceae bacterium]